MLLTYFLLKFLQYLNFIHQQKNSIQNRKNYQFLIIILQSSISFLFKFNYFNNNAVNS